MATLEKFTASEAARLSGVTLTMLDYLCREKFVQPSASSSRGRGKVRHFSFGDLVTLKVISRLLKSGVEVRRLAKGLRVVSQRLGANGTDGVRYLVTNGHEVFLQADGTLESLSESGQLAFAFLIDLKACEKELEAAGAFQAGVKAIG